MEKALNRCQTTYLFKLLTDQIQITTKWNIGRKIVEKLTQVVILHIFKGSPRSIIIHIEIVDDD